MALLYVYMAYVMILHRKKANLTQNHILVLFIKADCSPCKLSC